VERAQGSMDKKVSLKAQSIPCDPGWPTASGNAK
jgi:hypothetical protein